MGARDGDKARRGQGKVTTAEFRGMKNQTSLDARPARFSACQPVTHRFALAVSVCDLIFELIVLARWTVQGSTRKANGHNIGTRVHAGVNCFNCVEQVLLGCGLALATRRAMYGVANNLRPAVHRPWKTARRHSRVSTLVPGKGPGGKKNKDKHLCRAAGGEARQPWHSTDGAAVHVELVTSRNCKVAAAVY